MTNGEKITEVLTELGLNELEIHLGFYSILSEANGSPKIEHKKLYKPFDQHTVNLGLCFIIAELVSIGMTAGTDKIRERSQLMVKFADWLDKNTIELF